MIKKNTEIETSANCDDMNQIITYFDLICMILRYGVEEGVGELKNKYVT